MADHIHQRILDAVQTVLRTAATAASTNVYLDRVEEINVKNLPAIDILGPDESADDDIALLTQMHFPAPQLHAYRFSIRCVAVLANGSAKAARNLAGQVEAALLASASAIAIDGVSISMFLDEVNEQKDGSTSIPIFAVRQVWHAQFRTMAGAPTAPI